MGNSSVSPRYGVFSSTLRWTAMTDAAAPYFVHFLLASTVTISHEDVVGHSALHEIHDDVRA